MNGYFIEVLGLHIGSLQKNSRRELRSRKKKKAATCLAAREQTTTYWLDPLRCSLQEYEVQLSKHSSPDLSDKQLHEDSQDIWFPYLMKI